MPGSKDSTKDKQSNKSEINYNDYPLYRYLTYAVNKYIQAKFFDAIKDFLQGLLLLTESTEITAIEKDIIRKVVDSAITDSAITEDELEDIKSLPNDDITRELLKINVVNTFEIRYHALLGEPSQSNQYYSTQDYSELLSFFRNVQRDIGRKFAWKISLKNYRNDSMEENIDKEKAYVNLDNSMAILRKEAEGINASLERLKDLFRDPNIKNKDFLIELYGSKFTKDLLEAETFEDFIFSKDIDEFAACFASIGEVITNYYNKNQSDTGPIKSQAIRLQHRLVVLNNEFRNVQKSANGFTFTIDKDGVVQVTDSKIPLNDQDDQAANKESVNQTGVPDNELKSVGVKQNVEQVHKVNDAMNEDGKAAIEHSDNDINTTNVNKENTHKEQPDHVEEKVDLPEDALDKQTEFDMQTRIANAKDEFFDGYADFIKQHPNELYNINSNNIKRLERFAKRYSANQELQIYIKKRIARLQKIYDKIHHAEVPVPKDAINIDSDENLDYKIESKQVAQQSTTYGCWAVSLAEQLRYRGVDIDQRTIRAYRPNVSQFTHIESNKDTAASIYDYAPLIHKLLPNTAVNHLGCQTMSADEAENAISYVISYAARNNSVISFMRNGHYITILGTAKYGNEDLIVYHDPQHTGTFTISFDELLEFCKQDGIYKFDAEWLQDMVPVDQKQTANKDILLYSNPYKNMDLTRADNVWVKYDKDDNLICDDKSAKGKDYADITLPLDFEGNGVIILSSKIPLHLGSAPVVKAGEEETIFDEGPENSQSMKIPNHLAGNNAINNGPQPQDFEIDKSIYEKVFDGADFVNNKSESKNIINKISAIAKKSASYPNLKNKIEPKDDKFTQQELKSYLTSISSLGKHGNARECIKGLEAGKYSDSKTKIIKLIIDSYYKLWGDMDIKLKDHKLPDDPLPESADRLKMLNTEQMENVSKYCSLYFSAYGYDDNMENYTVRKLAKTIDVALISTVYPIMNYDKNAREIFNATLKKSLERNASVMSARTKRSNTVDYVELQTQLGNLQRKMAEKVEVNSEDVMKLQYAAMNYMLAKGDSNRSTTLGQLRYDSARDLYDLCLNITHTYCNKKKLEQLHSRLRSQQRVRAVEGAPVVEPQQMKPSAPGRGMH